MFKCRNGVAIRLLAAALLAVTWCGTTQGGEPRAADGFHQTARPFLNKYCSDCHADGVSRGGVSFDDYKTEADLLGNRELWLGALRYTRAGMMPPAKRKDRPTPEEQAAFEKCVKRDLFGLDPANPDPGRITIRRLNRNEYRNTIRDLMGIDFNTEEEFPPDDTGYGFDNISDVLTLPSMLLEKYVQAAEVIVAKSVPMVPREPAQRVVPGSEFGRSGALDGAARPLPPRTDGWLALSFYEPATVTNLFPAAQAGHYRLLVEFLIKGNNAERGFDSNRCEVVFKVDDEELFRKDYGWHEKQEVHLDFDRDWRAVGHRFSFEVKPMKPGLKKRSALEVRVSSVTVRGPMEEPAWVRPKNYHRFFTGESEPTPAGRRERARQILAGFAGKAFRRPVDAPSVNRLVGLAESVYGRPGGTFEAGVAHAMVAVLASPRFLFLEEGVAGAPSSGRYPLVDEYSLAARLAYFLWSSMPDEELTRLAASGRLRQNQAAQVKRMLADPKARAFTQNFTGQWLQARDMETLQVDTQAVLAREDDGGDDGGSPVRAKVDFDGEMRKSMRRETEMSFEYALREDRPVTELLESDYTFLNARLTALYEMTNLDFTGTDFRRVSLPPESPRGGILAQATVLMVTSNPTRTSPVKRGLFILDNILGTPPPPPPPDIPPLEASGRRVKNHTPTLRETLETHRAKPLCSSCHNRMDPLGLALENFNALGMWREKERGRPVDVSGTLVTGESFDSFRQLKHILATRHARDFYRTLTAKMLTYALGRGLEYYDVETVDAIVERLERENGRFSALLNGVIESAPFQKRRIAVTAAGSTASTMEPSPGRTQPKL